MLPKYKGRTNFNKKSSLDSTDKSNNPKLKHKKGNTNIKSNLNNSTKKSNFINKWKRNSINKSLIVKCLILIGKIKSTGLISNCKLKHKNYKD